MISIAISTYNRSKFTIDSFIKVLANPLIDDVVIVDDHSNVDEYTQLWNMCNGLAKVKLYRNGTNLQPLRNKAMSVFYCKNPWVILLDSDNIIGNDYIDTISKLELNENTFYSPQILFDLGREKELWNYSEHIGKVIDKQYTKKTVRNGSFLTLLNTGNYLVHRKNYLLINELNSKEQHLQTNDALYFSYKWLQAGNIIQVVQGLSYQHRIHPGSWYKNNKKVCGENTKAIEQLIKQW
jgi:hypothetical protein